MNSQCDGPTKTGKLIASAAHILGGASWFFLWRAVPVLDYGTFKKFDAVRAPILQESRFV